MRDLIAGPNVLICDECVQVCDDMLSDAADLESRNINGGQRSQEQQQHWHLHFLDRVHLHVLAALAEFERARIAERVRAGLARVRASGRRLGRPAASVAVADLRRTAHLSVREAAATLGVSRSVVHRARLSQKPLERAS